MRPVFVCLDCANYSRTPYLTPPALAQLIESRSGGEIAFVQLADFPPAQRPWCCDMCLRPDARFLQAAWIGGPELRPT